MSFVRLLPLLLLIPALALADSDKNFKIQSSQFTAGNIIEPIADMAITVDGKVVVSQKPSFPLKDNRMYLRHKMGPKEYQWVSGVVHPQNFKKLHTYSLAENHLTLKEVVKLRFYGTQNAKAFQDETDIYFDKSYIYSPRIPKMFFIKNGRWQLLKETENPGVIQVKGDAYRDLSVASLKFSTKGGKNLYAPLNPATYSVNFTAPGYLPVVEPAVVKAGEVTVMTPNLPRLDPVPVNKVFTTVTEGEAEMTDSLEDTEVLFDKFTADIQKNVALVNLDDFEKVYPPMKDASAIGTLPSDAGYKDYVERYNGKKAEAKILWRNSKMAGVSEVNEAFQKQFAKQQSPSKDLELVPTAVEPVQGLKNADSKQVTEVKMTFGKNKERVDFAWTGVVLGVPADSVYAWLKDNNGKIKITAKLANNKPVWIYAGSDVPTRHHYRYVKMDFTVDGTVHAGQGDFVLPEYIKNEPEVKAWLDSIAENPIQEQSAEKKEVVKAKDAEIPDVIPAMNVPRVMRDRIHGNVALIDSGTFRYKGRVVSLSPYAIMTTEFTQKMFDNTMNKLDSAKRVVNKPTYKHPQKPVHNITWNDARFVCQTLGGDLPTEAQWEFAARADNNEGAIWNLDDAQDPGVYAVYRDNSFDTPKGGPEYGPQVVSSKKSNAWGIFDMSGNVAEWTRDKYFMFSIWVEPSNPTGAMMGSTYVYKGGSWKDKEKKLNVTDSDDEDPRYWSESIGFRCVYPINIIKE
ncbi:MAG: formylglycine-generating enzyme family protein [Fibrobacter sp.]|nr:formylglycine-generating enzyme family protein [Fibrobacter sp.]